MGTTKNIFRNGKAMEENSIQQKAEQEIALEKALSLLNNYKRKAYLPRTQVKQREFSSASKFGGFPYLRNKNDWPICPNCGNNMQLFLQLNLEDLPERRGEGLIQLFYCTNSDPHCESELEAFFPFSQAVCCRKISIAGESSQVEPNLQEIFSEKVIIGWDMVNDYPHFEEHEALGIEIDDNLFELMEEQGIGMPIEKDKLFGWPHWIQSVEYPHDRKTEAQMDLLFQLASEDNLPYMFGDAGIGYLAQSPDNKHEFGFGWACA
ncbi:MAG: DUF1963 domain-containing protein [Bacteroidota bacterium]